MGLAFLGQPAFDNLNAIEISAERILERRQPGSGNGGVVEPE